MAPRPRYVKAAEGNVVFCAGAAEYVINDFLAANKLTLIEQKKSDQNDIILVVPPAERYYVPDHIYVWLKN